MTREQYAHMLANLARAKGEYAEAPLDVLSDISDADGISDWALADVAWAVASKVMGNGGFVNSAGTLTRAEAVALAVNYQPASLDGHDRVINPRP